MHINLERLDKLCKGDREKKERYLRQFLELVPPHVEQIKVALDGKDRQEVRKRVHFLSPQLAFFGISDFVTILESLASDSKGDLYAEQIEMVEQSLKKVDGAVLEVEELLDQFGNNPDHENKKPDH